MKQQNAKMTIDGVLLGYRNRTKARSEVKEYVPGVFSIKVTKFRCRVPIHVATVIHETHDTKGVAIAVVRGVKCDRGCEYKNASSLQNFLNRLLTSMETP